MPKPLVIHGKVEDVRVTPEGFSASLKREKIVLIRDHGVRGDRHAGTRLVDSREDELLALGIPKEIEIANHRQVSITSTEELALIAEALGLSCTIPAGSLGENLVVSGIPRLTELPSGTLLAFTKPDGAIRTAVIAVWKENGPCIVPGQVIESTLHITGIAARFPKAAMGKRGLVGSVYASGVVQEGDTVIAHVRPQRIYRP